ncbi:methionine ABC transporter permease [Glycomyces algeriensis]|uniref:ABC transporter permease n=1 Tax=Glycomyces algeriensis TaxID=256037 RepID=A0A9W6LDY9_9ACTN|nr:methionine ABC transporter permease [Glycomyces algeriensis]MDA1368727.1 ABC transporter permease [Glycomyces algeriensis]MDR7352500.1 D-methionine transport system permease protein [Glycomyces algeriensis]GLI40183.1 ABC transporter permease [Glycomyces algeriensis]
MTDRLVELLTEAFWETLHIVAVAGVWTMLGGLLLGTILYITSKPGPKPIAVVNAPLGLIVNIGRSAPFVLLMVAVVPLTRLITGTSIGTEAAIVPLAVASIPFFARLVEGALLEVQPGLIEAARSMGAGTPALVWRVVLPEATPGLIRGFTVTLVAIVSYSAMAGIVGGGGLGDLAYRYGYQRFETEYMIWPLVILVVLVQLFQILGDRCARTLDRR